VRAFLTTVLILVLLGVAVGYYLWSNAERFSQGSVLHKAGKLVRPDTPPPPARIPEDYVILEGQGGVPRAEAERAGLATERYAYLSTFTPTQISAGIVPESGVVMRGQNYDFCYRFNPMHEEMQYLEFNLNGKWDELHFGFGFDDKHPSDPEKKWSLELTVQCDGQPGLPPHVITPVDKPVFAMVDVRGVQRVTLVCRRIGQVNPFTPVLVDPFVKLAPQTP
jgi:hypothetical protein